MSEMYLRQPGFTCIAWRPFTKNKESIQKFKETRGWWYIYQNELDNECFQRDMAYGDFKDLTRRTAFDKILRYEAFNIGKIQNMMDMNVEFLQWFIHFLIKKLMLEQLKMRIILLKN